MSPGRQAVGKEPGVGPLFDGAKHWQYYYVSMSSVNCDNVRIRLRHEMGQDTDEAGIILCTKRCSALAYR
jgi:hypothetical protein